MGRPFDETITLTHERLFLPIVADKPTIETASRLGAAGLAKLWDAMHTAELSVKSGRRSPSQALDALMGDLTLLFTPAQRRSPR